MGSMSTVYNPGKTPVRLDDEGRVLGGGERADVATNDRIKALVKKGALIEVAHTDEKER
jgi:hypothetical protein